MPVVTFLGKTLCFWISLKATVISLSLLLLILVLGTWHQVDHGLFQAQQKYFYSWYALVGGFFPIPGGKAVLFFVAGNLFGSMLIHFQLGWRFAGLWLIHLGLLVLLAGGFVTHLTGQESYLSLQEGMSSNLTQDYRDWELAVWTDETPWRSVEAIDIDGLQKGKNVSLTNKKITARSVFANAKAYTSKEPMEKSWRSASGIDEIREVKPAKDPQENVPALILDIEGARQHLLFGNDAQPTKINGDTVSLRRKRYELPIIISLVDFRKKYYPNSEIPESFSSLIEVRFPNGATRDVVIEMNKPFRYGPYTFYQASFAQNEDGSERSTFAVTKNYGRLLPYIASGLTFIGLVLQFLSFSFRRRLHA